MTTHGEAAASVATDAFAVDAGACGSGPAAYADGLVRLPGDAVFGVECVERIDPADAAGEERPDFARRTGAFAGSLRAALGAPGGGNPLPLPWRLAVSGMRAGLGAIEESLRVPEGVRVALVLSDGARVLARMPPELVERIRRDAGIARAAAARALAAADARAGGATGSGADAPAGSPSESPAGSPAESLAESPTGRPASAIPPEPDTVQGGTGAPLTSIFRYEKRNGRLRRVQIAEADALDEAAPRDDTQT